MTDLDKAREWAERRRNISDSQLNAGVKAAAEVIQSLPDQWIDAEKLKAIIADMDHCLKMESTTDFSKGIDNATTSWRDALKALITPKLPTLADMTPEERAACKWMQVKTWCEVGFLVWVDEASEVAEIITQNNGALERKFNDVTPLTGEPKFKWPGGVGDAEIVDEPETVDAPPAEKAALPKPEDVPDNELWLVERGGSQWFAKRNRSWSMEFTWRLISMTRESSIARDSEITLIHKLVPEPPALPEGMRLADHEEYGRVVVAPHANTHGEEYFYRTNEDNPWGASHAYRPTEEFTFLGGDQHV